MTESNKKDQPNSPAPSSRFRKLIKQEDLLSPKKEPAAGDKSITQPIKNVRATDSSQSDAPKTDLGDLPTVVDANLSPDQSQIPTHPAQPLPPPPPGSTDPLPRHVDQVDLSATRVSPAAFYPETHPLRSSTA